MAELEIVLENKDRFEEICKILIKSESSAARTEADDFALLKIQQILKWRKKELDTFEAQRLLSSNFLGYCKIIPPGKIQTESQL